MVLNVIYKLHFRKCLNPFCMHFLLSFYFMHSKLPQKVAPPPTPFFLLTKMCFFGIFSQISSVITAVQQTIQIVLIQKQHAVLHQCYTVVQTKVNQLSTKQVLIRQKDLQAHCLTTRRLPN
jgi:hypothetical protein